MKSRSDWEVVHEETGLSLESTRAGLKESRKPVRQSTRAVLAARWWLFYLSELEKTLRREIARLMDDNQKLEKVCRDLNIITLEQREEIKSLRDKIDKAGGGW